jgi:hypothetical protein
MHVVIDSEASKNATASKIIGCLINSQKIRTHIIIITAFLKIFRSSGLLPGQIT